MPDQTRCSVCHHASLWRITVLVRIRNWHFVGKKIRLRLACVRRPRRRIHWRLFGWLWFGGHIYSPGFAWAWGSARHRSRVAASGGERVFSHPMYFYRWPAVLGLVGARSESCVPAPLSAMLASAASGSLRTALSTFLISAIRHRPWWPTGNRENCSELLRAAGAAVRTFWLGSYQLCCLAFR